MSWMTGESSKFTYIRLHLTLRTHSIDPGTIFATRFVPGVVATGRKPPDRLLCSTGPVQAELAHLECLERVSQTSLHQKEKIAPAETKSHLVR